MTLTKSDFKQIDNRLDLGFEKQRVRLEKIIDRKLDLKFDNQKIDIEQLLEKQRSKFHDEIDPILKEVTASRDERTINGEQHRRYDNRITTLEKIHPQGKHLATI